MCFLQRRRQSPCLIVFLRKFLICGRTFHGINCFEDPVTLECFHHLCVNAGLFGWKICQNCVASFWKPFGSSVGFTEGILCHGAHESRTRFRLSAVQCHRLGVDLKSRLSVGHWSAEEECSIPEGGLKVVGSPVARFQLKWWITSS